MQKITLHVRGMHEETDEGSVKAVLSKIEGVHDIHTDHPRKEVVVIAEDNVDPKDVKNALKNTDFDVGEFETEPYAGEKKKGFFSKLFGK